MPWTTYKDKEGNSHDIDNVDARWLQESGVNEKGLPATDGRPAVKWVDTGLGRPADRERWWRTQPLGEVLHPDGTKKLQNMEAWQAFNKAITEALLEQREAEAEQREAEAEWLKRLREGKNKHLRMQRDLKSQLAALTQTYEGQHARAVRLAARRDDAVQRVTDEYQEKKKELAQKLLEANNAYNREFQEAQEQYNQWARHKRTATEEEDDGGQKPRRRRKTQFGRNCRK